MRLIALLQALLASIGPAPGVQPVDPLEGLTPRQKAGLVVVSGLPAPKGVAGVIVQRWSLGEPRPRNALVFVDQEGGTAQTFGRLPPSAPASSYTSAQQAFLSGRRTGRALRRAGVHVDLAPVLDSTGGPLGSRHFRRPEFAGAFARGLGAGGVGACVKHFPGLGTARISTDESPQVHAAIRAGELAGFRRAIRAGVPCVMTSHAIYDRFGRRRASFSRRAYRFLRRTGFDGVAMTDSVSVFGSRFALVSARLAIRGGADLVLYTNGRDAGRAIAALVPLARKGRLDEQVERVLRLRRSLGLPAL
ncbi:MAG TPA: glycoside hydrolase family 3 N-terminal domain-containing protein [Gaiellaceae bacterium]|nr:glycoside hydrolase family 3 N-terminal domain-containing protein [Gaiellaceae bacterium]